MISSCYNCGCFENSVYAHENGFSLVKCCECGLLYLQDPPSDAEIFHAHKQGKHRGLKELNVTGRFNQEQVPKYLKILTDLFERESVSKKIWLDVGCGHEEFIEAVQSFSNGIVNIIGTEPNLNKVASAQ